MKHIASVILLLLVPVFAFAAEIDKVGNIQEKTEDTTPKPKPYAWRNELTLGERYIVPLDTLLYNFYETTVPIIYSPSFATTGNFGAPGFDNIYFNREEGDLFFFKEAFYHRMRRPSNFEWYNTRLPFTQVAYHSGGSSQTAQDELSATFSANVNKQIELGAGVDYITARGQYLNQADQEISFRIFGSYIGERYQAQIAFNRYNFVMQENGGITDDNYILDPASLQGGQKDVDERSIPVKLSSTYNRLIGNDLYLTHRYNLGFYEEEVVNDTLTEDRFVPVSSIIHTLKYEGAIRRFLNKSASEDTTYFQNTYLSAGGTDEITSYWALSNTLGISLHEGFSKYAKMGAAAYVTYEVREYAQAIDTIAPGTKIGKGYTIHPDFTIPRYTTEHALWVGGQLWKRKGAWFTYAADGRVGLVGPVLGDVDISGHVGSQIPLWNDTLSIKAYAFFKNTEPSLLHKQYVSNHFIWKNDFGKTRRLRVGGEISFPKTGTYINVGFENVQNHVYFDENCLPRQESASIQVISATLKQKFKIRALHLDLEGVYQFTSHPNVLPLPEFSAYGNLYVLFPILKVMHIQAGVDCRWYTAFKAPAYQPALLTRYNQNEVEIGNYPFMNVYVNVKLKKARFYALFSHFNQGWLGGSNYFSIPHYPLNPALFQFGVSVDFAN